MAAFLDNIFELIRTASSHYADAQTLECVRFSNQSSAWIDGLLGIARLRNRDDWFVGVGYGKLGFVAFPWTLEVQEKIYGADARMGAYYQGHTDPGRYAETGKVAEGEILDRYRAGLKQTFGYPMFSLAHFMTAAGVLQRSGYDAWNIRGQNGQTLLAAL